MQRGPPAPQRPNVRSHKSACASSVQTKQHRHAGYCLVPLTRRLLVTYSQSTRDLHTGYSRHLRAGYSCGLWLLFHTTIANSQWHLAPSALKLISEWVGAFFGCTECAEHFAQMWIDGEVHLLTGERIWVMVCFRTRIALRADVGGTFTC